MDKKEVIFGLILALFLAVFIAPFASQLPDGLTKAAQENRFLSKMQVSPVRNYSATSKGKEVSNGVKPLTSAPIADYHWPGIKNEKIAAAISGLAGTLAVFIIGYLVAAVLKKINPALACKPRSCAHGRGMGGVKIISLEQSLSL